MPRTTSPTKSRARPAAPSKQYEIHPAQPSHSGPGFLGSMVQGFGLGMGSSMGHRATDAIFGQSRSDQKIEDFQATRTVATKGGHPIQLTTEEASLLTSFGEKKKEFPQEIGSVHTSVQKPVESCEKLLQKYRDCMCGELFHCDQIYDEYFVCIQPK